MFVTLNEKLLYNVLKADIEKHQRKSFVRDRSWTVIFSTYTICNQRHTSRQTLYGSPSESLTFEIFVTERCPLMYIKRAIFWQGTQRVRNSFWWLNLEPTSILWNALYRKFVSSIVSRVQTSIKDPWHFCQWLRSTLRVRNTTRRVRGTFLTFVQ